jgi:hypothetical protein
MRDLGMPPSLVIHGNKGGSVGMNERGAATTSGSSQLVNIN